MNYRFTILLLFICGMLSAQKMTGSEVLAKSIEYHDPKGKWYKAKLKLSFEESRPNGSADTTLVQFKNRKNYFQMTQLRNGEAVVREVKNGNCAFEINKEEEISKQQQQTFQLNCPRTKMMHNYYSYLWGLPMKLQDEGTIIDPEVWEVEYEGIACYSFKATYQPKVGKDTWYFFVDKTNFRLVGYLFHHDKAKKDGEYITLEGEERFKKIRFPKTRKWYVSSSDKYLGTDKLLGKEEIK